MAWNAYKIVLRLQAPMHIGQARSGNLQITRPYVHGKALWGALTARITRDTTPAQAQDYQDMGTEVNKQLAFSYFYPTTGQDVTLWPWEDPEQFAWRYLGSYASTALDYSQNSAEEGTLHETEFITPHTREGEPVNLVGYIFAQDGCDLPWQEALPDLQLGGERTYGWGRVRLESCQKAEPTEKFFGLYALDLSAARPAVSLPEGADLLASAFAHGKHAIPARGRVVPLLGRETKSAHAHGREVMMAAICWEPGSRTLGEVPVQIGPYGIWEAVNEEASSAR